jgi:ribonuclease D
VSSTHNDPLTSPPPADIAEHTEQPQQAEHVTVAAIDTQDAYLAAVEKISAGHGPLAIDTERASGFRYSQRAYLIQIFRRGAGTFLFDPPAIGDFRALNDAIKGEEWVLHAASQDLPCLREVGLDPNLIFDTELGARLAGLPRVGLGTVVEALLGVHLAKEHSAADWSTRPLPQSWLVYAALDVELLVDLRDKVAELLDESGKLDIARQEFVAVLAHEPKPFHADGWRRLSGLHSLRSPRNLAVARELWEAREKYAREIDTAPGRLVPDSALLAAAKALPASKHDLAKLREFTGRASRSELGRWWDAIETGNSSDDLPTLRVSGTGMPPARTWSDRNPEADKRIKTAKAAIAQVSEQLSIPTENLLTPETLRRLSWTPPEPLDEESVRQALADLGARAWQIDVTAQTIAHAFVEADQSDEQSPEKAS